MTQALVTLLSPLVFLFKIVSVGGEVLSVSSRLLCLSTRLSIAK